MNHVEQQHDTSTVRPNLLQQISLNAYRILGLPSSATWPIISERATALRRAAKAGIPLPSPWTFDWYGPVRQDEAAISSALGRLQNPDQRLNEKLFWIGQSELFVKCLAIRGLSSSIEPLQSSPSGLDRHDAAVLSLISCFSNDSGMQDVEQWRSMLQLWLAVTQSDEFWNSLSDTEIRGEFQPEASPEDLNQLKENALKLVVESIAELARDAASRSDSSCCRRALDVIRTAPMPLPEISGIEENVLGPYEDVLNQTISRITKPLWAAIQKKDGSEEVNRQPCSIALDLWKGELQPKFLEFVALAGSSNFTVERAAQAYADCLVSIGSALTWADQWIEAEEIKTRARDCLPEGSPSRRRIEESLPKLAASAERQRAEARSKQAATAESAVNLFVEFCESLVRRSEDWAHTRASERAADLALLHEVLRIYRVQAAPWLTNILEKYQDNNKLCKRARNAAAKCLCSLGEGFLCLDALDFAETITFQASTLVLDCEELEREIRAQIKFIQSEKHRLQLDSGEKDALSREAERKVNKRCADVTKSGAKGNAPDSVDSRFWRQFTAVVIVASIILLGCILSTIWESANGKTSTLKGRAIAEYLTSNRGNHVADARKSGYSDVEIIEYLLTNPIMARRIRYARANGHSSRQIVDNLISFQEQRERW